MSRSGSGFRNCPACIPGIENGEYNCTEGLLCFNMKPADNIAKFSGPAIPEFDPDGRMFVKSIALSDGRIIDVRCPVFKDIIAVAGKPAGEMIIYIMSVCTGLTEEEILRLPAHNGNEINNVLLPYLNATPGL